MVWTPPFSADIIYEQPLNTNTDFGEGEFRAIPLTGLFSLRLYNLLFKYFEERVYLAFIYS